MKVYGGIDLHSDNSMIVLTDEADNALYRKRLPNDLPLILGELTPYRSQIEGLVVESTYNWYWQVDGLMEAGYQVHLVNTAAIVQYEGLKYTDDETDARWLAKLLRLGLLPEGTIYPKAERSVRDLMRKRSQLVRQHTMNLQSVQNLMVRNRGQRISASAVRKLSFKQVEELTAQAGEDQRHRGRQDGGTYIGAGLLLHPARPSTVRCEQGLCLKDRWAEAASRH